jgi:hypothetical protein
VDEVGPPPGTLTISIATGFLHTFDDFDTGVPRFRRTAYPQLNDLMKARGNAVLEESVLDILLDYLSRLDSRESNSPFGW